MTRNRIEDDSPSHSGRGLPACTEAASDKANARMETKAEVEMAYMVKQEFCVRVYALVVEGSSPSLYTRVKPDLYGRTDASWKSLRKWCRHG